jgi:hypothetical protein
MGSLFKNRLKFNHWILDFGFYHNISENDHKCQSGLMEMEERNNSKCSRSRFRQHEDELLQHLVFQHGTHAWRKIAKHLPGRNVRQCRDRWNHYLAPSVKMPGWTSDEDAILQARVLEFGVDWERIVLFFPARNPLDVQQRWILISHGYLNCVNIESPMIQMPVPMIDNEFEIVKPAMVEQKPPIPEHDDVATRMDFGDAFWFAVAENALSKPSF